MKTAFGKELSRLRKNKGLTNRELALKAKVPHSLIAGLQGGSRQIGELQASKIGEALELSGATLSEFILQGIGTCTEKVLNKNANFSSSVINLFLNYLHDMGLSPEGIKEFTLLPQNDKAIIEIIVIKKDTNEEQRISISSKRVSNPEA